MGKSTNPGQSSEIAGALAPNRGLADRIARWTGHGNRLDTSIPGLVLHRWETPTQPTSYMMGPSICLIGQGRKRLLLGEETYVYDSHRFLITSVDLPVVTQIIEADADKPYLGLTLEIDLGLLARLIVDQNMPSGRTGVERRGIAVSDVSAHLLDAFNRLIDLLENPDDVSALAPLVHGLALQLGDAVLGDDHVDLVARGGAEERSEERSY